jgi:type IV secretory pathway VirB9-like protein
VHKKKDGKNTVFMHKAEIEKNYIYPASVEHKTMKQSEMNTVWRS